MKPLDLSKPDRRCTAHSTRTKERCRRWAIRGGKVCATHGGRAPQVKATAQERLAALVDPALKVHRQALQSFTRNPQAAVTVARDVLDRTGFKPTEKHELSGAIGVVALTPEQVARMSDEQLAAARALVATVKGEPLA
jgi:hypothetical protein